MPPFGCIRMLDSCLECVGLRSRDKMGDRRKGGRSAWRRWTSRKRNAGNYSERILSVGQKPNTLIEEERQTHFDGNEIKTAKYSIFTFLPRLVLKLFSILYIVGTTAVKALSRKLHLIHAAVADFCCPENLKISYLNGNATVYLCKHQIPLMLKTL